MTDEERARNIMRRFNGNYLNEEELERAIVFALAAVREECANDNADLKERLERFEKGYHGSCYACEPVGILNQNLEQENAALREQLATAQATTREDCAKVAENYSTAGKYRGHCERIAQAIRTGP